MTSDVVLSAAMRNNLLSLTNTQNQINTTQNALSTGKKVNSALDNPLSFFAAQSLDSQSSALSNLLDAIGQSIQTIQAANTGVTSLTSLVQQAQAIATQAATVQGSAAATATVSGDTNVSNLDLSTISAAGTTGGLLYQNSKIKLTLTDGNNQTITFGADSNASVTLTSGTEASGAAPGNATATIDTGSSGVQSISSIVDAINSIKDQNGTQLIKASVSSSGFLQLTSNAGTNFSVEFQGDGTSAQTGAASLTLSQSFAATLGYTSLAQPEQPASVIAGTTATPSTKADGYVGFTARASQDINSFALADITTGTSTAHNTASASSKLSNLVTKDANGNYTNALGTLTDETNTVTNGTDTLSFNVGINGSVTRSISLNKDSTIQDVVDGINNDSVLGGKIQASYNTTTGQIAIKAIDPSVTSVQLGTATTDNTIGSATATGSELSLNLGFGLSGAQDTLLATATTTTAPVTKYSGVESIVFGAAAGNTTSQTANYNKILSQIDSTAKDSGYQGVNLLNGDNLVTNFNADRSSTLTTTGGVFSAIGLGIKQADFSSSTGIAASQTQLQNALTTLQNFGSSISTDLSIMQNRQTFSTNMINVLKTGSANLTTADTNAESANLLTLQTRQQLGVDALSLAAQSQQSVLKLF